MSLMTSGRRFDEILGAVLEHGASTVVDGQLALLQHGAHGAIEDEDAGGKGVKQRLLALSKRVHWNFGKPPILLV